MFFLKQINCFPHKLQINTWGVNETYKEFMIRENFYLGITQLRSFIVKRCSVKACKLVNVFLEKFALKAAYTENLG